MRRKIIPVLLIIGIAYYFYGHFFAKSNSDNMAGGPPVSVSEVIERDVLQWHEFSGRLVAVDSAEIRPQVSGIIEQIHFQEGQLVEKDHPLFTIDQRPYAAALQEAEAHVALTTAELGRAKTLLADKAIPKRDYDQRLNDSAIAKAELVRAQLNFDFTVIKAPVAGRVGRAEITVGNLVDAGGNTPVLTTIVSDKPIYGDFDIDEQTFLHYSQSIGLDTDKLKKVPATLELSGDNNVQYTGYVQSFDNQLNMRSGTIRVRTVFANDDSRLIPGLFARIKLGSAEPAKALLITDRAVGTDQNKRFVLVVGADNKVEHREVKLGDISDGLRIVTDGLKAGEKIIVSGTQRVMMPGQPVTPEVVAMDGKTPPVPAEKETK